MEKEDDGVLVIRRVHVAYRLELEADGSHAAAARRVHGFHADKCPVYRTLKNSIRITTSLDLA